MAHIFDKPRRRFAGFYSRSREKKLELFQQLTSLKPGAFILDVGIEPREMHPYDNLLEKRLGDEFRIVGITLRDPSSLKNRYPTVRFVRADGCPLPFKPGVFDAVYSNAVIEHVGGQAQQRQFVAEAIRTSKMGFLTTPNYWFPVELHVSLPIVHYTPRKFRRVLFKLLAGENCARYMDGVHLLSARKLRRLFPPEVAVRVTKLRATFLPETLVAFFKKRA